MFGSGRCRYLSTTEDQNIQRQMGSLSVDEAIEHWIGDAANPSHLDALAFQFLCVARRCKTKGLKEGAKKWKTAWRRVGEMAASARARVAALPTRASDPALFNHRSVGKPGCLDADLFLPHSFSIDMTGCTRTSVYTGSYSPPLTENEIYDVHGSRLGETWITIRGSEHSFKMSNNTLRALQDLGRLVPVARTAMARAA